MGTEFVNSSYMRTISNMVVSQRLFETSTTAEMPIGFPLRLADGRTFMYSKNGAAALAPGKMVQSALKCGHADLYDCAIAEIATTGGGIGGTVLTVTLNGSTYALAANELSGGTLIINDDTGEGHSYRVSANTVAAVSSAVTVTLEDPLHVAIVAGSTATLCPNEYYGTILHPAPPTSTPLGIPPLDIPIDHYYWLQTYGRCCGLQGAAWVVDAPLTCSATTDGAIIALTAATFAVEVGRALKVGADTEYGPMILSLAA